MRDDYFASRTINFSIHLCTSPTYSFHIIYLDILVYITRKGRTLERTVHAASINGNIFSFWYTSLLIFALNVKNVLFCLNLRSYEHYLKLYFFFITMHHICLYAIAN